MLSIHKYVSDGLSMHMGRKESDPILSKRNILREGDTYTLEIIYSFVTFLVQATCKCET